MLPLTVKNLASTVCSITIKTSLFLFYLGNYWLRTRWTKHIGKVTQKSLLLKKAASGLFVASTNGVILVEKRKQPGWRSRERETESKPKNWSLKGSWKVSISISKIHKAKSSSTYNKEEKLCVQESQSQQSQHGAEWQRGYQKITNAA